MQCKNLMRVPQFAAASPFSESQLRWWIYTAELNGLADAGAIVRLGRRVYIDPDRFDGWVQQQQTRRGAAR